MKKLSIIFCICTLLLCNLLAGCGSKEPAPAADHKLRVVVTFNAMKEFTQAVGQDKIHITSLIPDGTEPHDFQPTTKTMQALSKADILIYNSTGMERWVEQQRSRRQSQARHCRSIQGHRPHQPYRSR